MAWAVGSWTVVGVASLLLHLAGLYILCSKAPASQHWFRYRAPCHLCEVLDTQLSRFSPCAFDLGPRRGWGIRAEGVQEGFWCARKNLRNSTRCRPLVWRA